MDPDVDGGPPPVHPAVRQVADRHLAEVHRVLPGLVEMLYLVGSVALGDYRHGVSDVDFLAVTSRPPAGPDLATLARIHSGIRPQRWGVPFYDGVYVDRGALASPPDREQPAPHVVGGEFRTDRPCGELNPVLWWTLATCGVPERGPAPGRLGLRLDPDRLRRYSLDNLRTYWQRLAGEIRSAVAGRDPDAPADPGAVVWAVLGPGRLHHTLATGAVTSKSGVVPYLRQRFPAWADLADRAGRARHGSQVGFRTTDALAAADLIDAVTADAWRRFGTRA